MQLYLLNAIFNKADLKKHDLEALYSIFVLISFIEGVPTVQYKVICKAFSLFLDVVNSETLGFSHTVELCEPHTPAAVSTSERSGLLIKLDRSAISLLVLNAVWATQSPIIIKLCAMFPWNQK